MSNLLLQKIVLLRVTEVGKIILKKKRPLLLARSVLGTNFSEILIQIRTFSLKKVHLQM